jgi:integrase/recombinase XerD
MSLLFSAGSFEVQSNQVLASLENAHTRMMYKRAMEQFLHWWRRKGDLPLDRPLVEAYIGLLTGSGYSEATANQCLSAIKKAVSHAADAGTMDLATARDIVRISGFSKKIHVTGRFLTAREAEALINAPAASGTKGARDRALLALLLGCALRGGEAAKIQLDEIQKQGSHWVLTNVVGTRSKVRTVLIPDWAKKALDAWVGVSRIRNGAVFRAVDRSGNISVAEYGQLIGIEVKPRDLRLTCAQLCRNGGGELEEIQLLLGHASIQTTERFIGRKRMVASAPNERLRMRWFNRELAS